MLPSILVLIVKNDQSLNIKAFITVNIYPVCFLPHFCCCCCCCYKNDQSPSLLLIFILYASFNIVFDYTDNLGLQILRTRLPTVGSFSVFGPSTWNDLPLPLRQKTSLDSLKCNLKTCLRFLFRAAVFIHLKSPFAARFKLCR